MKLVTLPEAAKQLHLSENQLRIWARSGRMKGWFKLGDSKVSPWRIDQRDLERFKESRQARS